MKNALGDTVEIKKAGGSGYKSLEVLNGWAGAYIHTGIIKLWDLCAPNAILRAAGGHLTNLAGEKINYKFDQNPVHYDGVLASMTEWERIKNDKIIPQNQNPKN